MGSKVIRNITKVFRSASGVLFGRKTAGTGRGEELTPSDVRTLISVYSTSEVDSIIGGIDGLTSADIDTLAEINAILTDADLASVTYVDGLASNYATAAQGALADSALQPADIASGTITARADDVNLAGGSDGDVLTVQADGSLALETPSGGGGSGDVVGPASATDNAVARYDTTTGKLLQNSAVTIDDSGNVTGVVALTASGVTTNSGNSAVSAPIIAATGTWYTGGSATTTKPHILIQPTGTTSTNWSTSGTAIGVNSASGFAGNLIDLQANNVSQFKVGTTGYGTFAVGLYAGSGNVLEVNSLGVGVSSSVYFAWSSTSNAGAGKDLRLSRNAAGVMQIGTSANNAAGSLLLTNLTASGLLKAGTYTVGTLPSAASNAYKFATVSDSSVTTFGTTVAGGGSSKVQVYSNGSNWTVNAA